MNNWKIENKNLGLVSLGNLYKKLCACLAQRVLNNWHNKTKPSPLVSISINQSLGLILSVKFDSTLILNKNYKDKVFK
jgi:hypothetical protein